MSAWNEMVFDAAADGHIREALDLARFDEVLKGRRRLRNAFNGEPMLDGKGALMVPGGTSWILEVD